VVDSVDILQGLVTLLGIAAGILGLLGKSRYAKMLKTIIIAIEEGLHTDSKGSVRRQSIIDHTQADIDCEIVKVTGKRVKKIIPIRRNGGQERDG